MLDNIVAMSSLPLDGKQVLIREDLNVPIEAGQINSDARILAALPTINQALEKGAKIILMSHLGRPKEGIVDDQYSLAPVAIRLSELLDKPVRLIKNWRDGVTLASNEVVLLENVRFNVGEKSNDEHLAKQLAGLADVFVMDAFASAHRAHASTHGVAKFSPISCAGPLLMTELNSLAKAMQNPQSPVVAIVGGAKVSTKLTVLENLLDKVDSLIVGGGIANTFIAASGHNVGKSLYEADLIPVALSLMEQATSHGCTIPLPIDVVVATEFNASAKAVTKSIGDVTTDELILDIGVETANLYSQYIDKAATVIWNGPVGVFEFDAFAKGSEMISNAIAKSQAFSLAGGGDTLAAIDKFNIAEDISYISTGGGAFLEFLEGKSLPAVEVLTQSAIK